nr:amidase 1 [Quercus suber]
MQHRLLPLLTRFRTAQSFECVSKQSTDPEAGESLFLHYLLAGSIQGRYVPTSRQGDSPSNFVKVKRADVGPREGLSPDWPALKQHVSLPLSMSHYLSASLSGHMAMVLEFLNLREGCEVVTEQDLLTLFSPLVACLQATTAFGYVQWNINEEGVFELENTSYFANTRSPRATFQPSERWATQDALITVIQVNASIVTASLVESTLRRYDEEDDVFSMAFTGAVLFNTSDDAAVHSSALDYLEQIGCTHVLVNRRCSIPAHKTIKSIAYNGAAMLSSGPYYLSSKGDSVTLFRVYRLYEDSHRDFLYGTYATDRETGMYTSLDISTPQFGYPAIPVPSRIYSWSDPRPFAGFRVAVKDLFDLNGLVTTGGSRAWALINPRANRTAPAIQRILDLGGTVVGRFKLAQFASGGGCSVAAYDWLDFAIGSDTGESMRLPAAVSGTYGQRPSQGMISLEGAIPVGGATDTAGVFSRDPYKWIHFSKNWYTPALHQSSNITGLSPLQVPDTTDFPKTILYPIDYLPLNISAAQPILEAFIANLTSIFGMQVKRFNFSATIASASDPDVANFTYLNIGPIDVINSHTQYEAVGRPLITQWAEMFDGRFPPIDSVRRTFWHEYNETQYSQEAYDDAVRQKRTAVDWYETHIQYSTPESCSESVMLYDIGPGGLPSYREEQLNYNPNATFLDFTPPGATYPGASICPLYGCADFTIPLGQVPYWSQVTFAYEMVPVTINMVVKRGCDFVLYNMVEKLADRGVLKPVKTGKTAF